MSALASIQSRIAILKQGRMTPTSVGLSREDWEAVKAEYRAEHGLRPQKGVAGEDVFGVPVTVHPGISGNFIAYSGGLEIVDA